jgi:adenylylsulfate kinase-like enzyme
MFVIVAGPPGSGKSTLAMSLAPELGLPLIAKDEIKEALMDVLGPAKSVDQSRELGRAAVMAMLTGGRGVRAARLAARLGCYAIRRVQIAVRLVAATGLG